MTNQLEAERKYTATRTIEKEIDLLVNFYGKSLTRDEKVK